MSHHGKGRKRRVGVHKHARSPETQTWDREHLIPPRPPWMDKETYVRLAEVREEGAVSELAVRTRLNQART